jgi:hypothetical protein
VHERILERMRKRIRLAEYVVTVHARKEMNEDNLTVFDVEHCILAGQIVERQRDQITREWKYRVRGFDTADIPIEVVAKLAPTGKLVVVTAYAL